MTFRRSDMEIEKTLQMNTLFAFYGPLLTEKQQEYMKLYYADDYSLGEISEAFNVSRQAIYDNVRRSESILLNYENKLHLVSDFERRQLTMQQVKKYINEKYENDSQLIEMIEDVVSEPKREGN